MLGSLLKLNRENIVFQKGKKLLVMLLNEKWKSVKSNKYYIINSKNSGSICSE